MGRDQDEVKGWGTRKGDIPVIMYILTYLQYFSCSLPHTSLPLWPCSLAKHLVTGKEIAIELAKGIPRTTHVYVPHEATRGRGGEGRGSCSVSGTYATPHTISLTQGNQLDDGPGHR